MTEKETLQQLLRQLPSVDEILQTETVKTLLKGAPRAVVLDRVRSMIDLARQAVLAGETDTAFLAADAVAQRVREAVAASERPAFLRVVNATGVILHTGLGRGVFCHEAVEALSKEVRGFTRLAYDLETGRRTPREDPVRQMLCRMTGAESAQVVNNNAAGTLLVLNTVANGKEVICSRGELVEIGGSFRIPEVMEMGGAKLREVGATNKTHLRDYEGAITDNTGALLRVHTSNYKIRGFTQSVSLEDLVALGRKYGLPVIDDVGSGTFYDMGRVGLTDETVLSESIRMGSDLICASTDKLMSGPQGGIILGKKRYVDSIRDNPLMRALRVGKMTLVVLEATLRVLMDEETVWERNPTYRMLAMPEKRLRSRALSLRRRLGWLEAYCDLAVEKDVSQVGGGATPVTEFPTWVLAVTPRTMSAGQVACALRGCPMPVCTRVKAGAVLLDPRTVFDGEDKYIVKGFKTVFEAGDD